MKLFTYYKLLQQSPQANRTISCEKVTRQRLPVGCGAGVCPSLLLPHWAARRSRHRLGQLSPLPPRPLHPRPSSKPWCVQESLTCWGPRFSGVRSAHSKLSLSQKSCQTKGEQSQVWLVRTCSGNRYTIRGAILILQGVLGLSQDERSSHKSHQRSCGKTTRSMVRAVTPQSRLATGATGSMMAELATPTQLVCSLTTTKTGP